jgi:hypothetical protein
MGFFAQPLSSQAGHEGGHLKYRIIPSKVGKRMRGNDFMRCSLAQSQHLRYEPQSSYNLLQSKELRRHHARSQTRGIVSMAVNDR